MAVAWIHLVTFLACQVLHDPLVERDVRHLVLWIVELAAVILTMRRVAGLGWFWSSPAINVIARLWVTFLILSFNVATLNALTGWESLWFKASWGTLSTFLFAALAWLFTPKFLIPAVQMYFTALLMARFPDWNNLIYGVSWWLALMGTASLRAQSANARAVMTEVFASVRSPSLNLVGERPPSRTACRWGTAHSRRLAATCCRCRRRVAPRWAARTSRRPGRGGARAAWR